MKNVQIHPFVEAVVVLGSDIKVTLAICIILAVLCIIRQHPPIIKPQFFFLLPHHLPNYGKCVISNQTDLTGIKSKTGEISNS